MTSAPIVMARSSVLGKLVLFPFFLAMILWLEINVILGGNIGFNPPAVWFVAAGGIAEAAHRLSLAEWCNRAALNCYHEKGANDTHYAWLSDALGTVLKQEGRLTEAEPYFKNALQIRLRVLGRESFWVASSLKHLGELYRDAGRSKEAMPICEDALRLSRRLNGSHSFATTEALVDLGLLYQDGGYYAQAEDQFSESWAIDRDLLGEDNPWTANTELLLAIMRERQGNHKMADPVRIAALKKINRKGERQKPYYKYSSYTHNLAVLCSEQGHYAEAEPLFKDALEIAKTQSGTQSTDDLRTMQHLAELYTRQGRYAEAEALAQETLELRIKMLGRCNSDTGRTADLLGQIYEQQGMYEEARVQYAHAITARLNTLGIDSPLTTATQANIRRLNEKISRQLQTSNQYQ